jgi:hypothetical protein
MFHIDRGKLPSRQTEVAQYAKRNNPSISVRPNNRMHRKYCGLLQPLAKEICLAFGLFGQFRSHFLSLSLVLYGIQHSFHSLRASGHVCSPGFEQICNSPLLAVVAGIATTARVDINSETNNLFRHLFATVVAIPRTRNVIWLTIILVTVRPGSSAANVDMSIQTGRNPDLYRLCIGASVDAGALSVVYCACLGTLDEVPCHVVEVV